jgi:purine-binding chemotaxis protein CheW
MEMIAESANAARAPSAQTRNPTPAPASGPGHRPVSGRAAAAAAAQKTVRHGEFLTFRLGGEEYGIDILRVQEIRSYEPPTRIANSPTFLKGVVNLRGVIVPILDLRIKLGCESAEYNGFTVVIVLNVHDRVVGVVVDSVSDVIELQGDQVKEAPQLNSNVDAGFITGIGTVKSGDAERMLILVDIQSLMGSADMGLVDAVH